MGQSDYDRFQDRSPRPGLNFDRMIEDYDFSDYKAKKKDDWADHYTECALRRIESGSASRLDPSKKPTKCTSSWQDDFIRKIKDKIIAQFIAETSLEEFTLLKQSSKKTQ